MKYKVTNSYNIDNKSKQFEFMSIEIEYSFRVYFLDLVDDLVFI